MTTVSLSGSSLLRLSPIGGGFVHGTRRYADRFAIFGVKHVQLSYLAGQNPVATGSCPGDRGIVRSGHLCQSSDHL
jgi:hypothetical protein